MVGLIEVLRGQQHVGPVFDQRADGSMLPRSESVPSVAANLGIVSWLARRLTPTQTVARTAPALAVAIAAIVILSGEGALRVTLGATALAVAICLSRRGGDQSLRLCAPSSREAPSAPTSPCRSAPRRSPV
jgi:hypothetical protein